MHFTNNFIVRKPQIFNHARMCFRYKINKNKICNCGYDVNHHGDFEYAYKNFVDQIKIFKISYLSSRSRPCVVTSWPN